PPRSSLRHPAPSIEARCGVSSFPLMAVSAFNQRWATSCGPIIRHFDAGVSTPRERWRLDLSLRLPGQAEAGAELAAVAGAGPGGLEAAVDGQALGRIGHAAAEDPARLARRGAGQRIGVGRR